MKKGILYNFYIIFLVALLSLTVFASSAACISYFETKLVASDPESGDYLGVCATINGNVVAVGSNNNNAKGNNSGAVYVFRYDGVNWLEEAKLTASDGASGNTFGRSVALDGDILLIGADHQLSHGAGSAYIFRYNGSTWVEEAILTASDSSPGDRFGISTSLSGDLAVIGAAADDGWTGSVYVFRYDGANWVQEAKIRGGDTVCCDRFGISVSIDNDTIAAGAQYDNVVGNPLAGSAYIFRHNGTIWLEEAKLIASDAAMVKEYGHSVSISNDVLVVSTWFDAAYVYRYDGANWPEEAKITASDGTAGDQFGWFVAISGSKIVVGAVRDDNTGSAYLFKYDGALWVEELKFIASDSAAGDDFGNSVAIDNGTVVVGAVRDNVDGVINAGSVYLYESTDSDGDGIYNDVDEEPNSDSKRFSDIALGGVTSGQILSLDNEIAIEIMDSPDTNEGVKILVTGPSGGKAKIKLDGSKGTYKLDSGEFILTSGSVILDVIEGIVEVEFIIEETLVLVYVDGKVVFDEISLGEKLQDLVVSTIEGTVKVNDVTVPPETSYTVKSVLIDIKPGSDPNCFNNDGHGVIPLAILSSGRFDATQVDPLTVSLDGLGVRVVGKGNTQAHIDDVNGDGLADLMMQIEDEDGTYQEGDTIASLSGETYDGMSIMGTDSICIVP